MTPENVIGAVIFAIVALIMILIGVYQLNYKTPVGFYSGKTPPKSDEITDVKGWNVRHGIMWIIYGMIMLLGYCIGLLVGNETWSVIPTIGGCILPLPFMIIYHSYLSRKYRIF